MKPRRDITLGEMQDECSKRMHICAPDVHGNNECKYFETCKQMRSGVFVKPCPEIWDLSDPPRFNEQQMALLRALWDMGARTVRSGYTTDVGARADDERGGLLFAWVGKSVGLTLQLGETLDLAELLGKESNEK